MAVVPIILDGVMYPKGKAAGDKPVPGVFVGNASIAGLGVGGGPIIPPEPPVEGPPPGTPTFPIWGPPGVDFPGTPGYPPVAGHPLPIPPPPGETIDPGWEVKVAWTPTTGWIVVLVPTDALVPTPSRRK
jgi:hypothetical protein